MFDFLCEIFIGGLAVIAIFFSLIVFNVKDFVLILLVLCAIYVIFQLILAGIALAVVYLADLIERFLIYLKKRIVSLFYRGYVFIKSWITEKIQINNKGTKEV